MSGAPPAMTRQAKAGAQPAAIVVMGVSGAGKTTIGLLLAARLGWAFIDADDLHPPANLAKMTAGHALDDADRAPWLAQVRRTIDGARAEGRQLVLACSALKQCYRQQIAGAAKDVAILWLHGAPELLRQRLAARSGHFMGAAMLDGQLATLQPPGSDEAVIALDVAPAPEVIVARAMSQLAARFPGLAPAGHHRPAPEP